MAQQVREDAGAEDERRQQPAAAVRVQLETRADRDDAHARELGPLPSRPLAERQVVDLVPAAASRSARLRYQRSAPPIVYG